MFPRLALAGLVLAGAVVCAAPQRRVYVVTWAGEADASPERRALLDQADQQLREALVRRGASVVDAQGSSPGAILLRPRLEVLPQALKLDVVGLRSSDRSVLGTVSTKASGSTREAQLKAVVQRASAEVDGLQ
jgi:hypothetical protein